VTIQKGSPLRRTQSSPDLSRTGQTTSSQPAQTPVKTGSPSETTSSSKPTPGKVSDTFNKTSVQSGPSPQKTDTLEHLGTHEKGARAPKPGLQRTNSASGKLQTAPPKPTPEERRVLQELGSAQKLAEVRKEAGNPATGLDRFLSMSMRSDKEPLPGSGTRNTASVDYMSMITADHPKTLGGISELLENRPHLLLTNDKGSGLDHLLVRGGTPPRVHDPQRGGFVPLTQQRLDGFGITDDTRITLGDRRPNDSVKHYHGTPTPHAVNGPFYHEEQKEGQCGIHAVNAMLGDRKVLPSKLTKFNETQLQTGGVILPPTAQGRYDEKAPSYDAADGNDPAMLQRFVAHQANKGRIDPGYKSFQSEQLNQAQLQDRLKSFKDDRMVLGTRLPGESHFVAFRKDAKGDWTKIDSLDSNQEKISPSDWVAKLKTDNIYFLHR
jgi:hypothetical protein